MQDNNRHSITMFLLPLSIASDSWISYTGMLILCWSLGLGVSALKFSSMSSGYSYSQYTYEVRGAVNLTIVKIFSPKLKP